MSFTALHRVLGRGPGPLTDELLDSAVAAGATESDDLDWKSELPPQKGLPQTDFPKDVAAMANSGQQINMCSNCFNGFDCFQRSRAIEVNVNECRVEQC